MTFFSELFIVMFLVTSNGTPFDLISNILAIEIKLGPALILINMIPSCNINQIQLKED